MLTGLASSEGCEGQLFHASLLASESLLAISDILCLVDALPRFLLSSSCGVLPVGMPLHPNSLSYKDTIELGSSLMTSF